VNLISLCVLKHIRELCLSYDGQAYRSANVLQKGFA